MLSGFDVSVPEFVEVSAVPDVSGTDSGGVHAGSLTDEVLPFPPKNFISGDATEYPTNTSAPSITTKSTPSKIFLPVLFRLLYKFRLERFTLKPFFLLISVSPFQKLSDSARVITGKRIECK